MVNSMATRKITITVEETLLKQVCHYGRRTPDIMQFFHDVLTIRLDVRKKRNSITDGLEPINA